MHPVALSASLLLLALALPAAADVTLVENGKARCTIYVTPGVMEDQTPETEPNWSVNTPAAQRIRLRESVKDLAAFLKQMSGAEIAVVSGPPKDDSAVAILIGEPALKRFGPPSKAYPLQQGFRYVVTDNAVGLAGESDLGTSYAIYELLHRLGCRWYMPSEMGQVIPSLPTITLATTDVSTGPATICRGIWYTDNAYARRNRSGGLILSAGHALEMYLTEEQRKEHPEWRATVKGQPHPHRLKWSAPGVAEAIGEKVLQYLEQHPQTLSVSLSPDDGLGYDDSPEDRALDAGDFDASLQDTSLTDRLVWFCNKIAEKVVQKHPDMLFGMLAYTPYSRPPVREKLHPNLVPQIAPITFSRAHPMTDDGEPNNKDLRYLVEGWAKAAPRLSYYFYGFFLAEVSAPNPMITKWGIDIPIIYKNNCVFWQPETLTNFETSLHAHYLGLRMAWDTTQDPKTIIDELHEKFYGTSAKEMAAYWHFIDRAWVDTPEYAGCGFGHMRRWNPQVMAEARRLMNLALAAARTPEEKFRVQMANDSLALFEQFMKLRHDLADGNYATIGEESKKYMDRLTELAGQYQPQFAFGRMRWTRPEGINGHYYAAFYGVTYNDAARIAQQFKILTPQPLRQWKFQVDKDKQGEAAGWAAPSFTDANWKSTDVMVDTWSALDLHNYMGSMWYRRAVDVPAVPAGKKIYLWIGATDGSAKVFVNGQHVPYVNPEGKAQPAFSGHCQPGSFDITAAVKPGAANSIALLCTRTDLNELGTGGLLAPVILYCEKD